MVVAVIASGAGGAALAQQTAAADDSSTVGEVVVTAQFREQNLQNTPIAITAVNAAMLEARGQTDISQVAAQAPNVTLKAAGGQGSSSMVAFIRGVGQTDFNFALEPGVGVYVDDVYYATLAGSLLDLLDLERVEVLRGPQGTLAGKNSIGGAIKMYTKKPTGSGGYLQATYGSYNRIDARGAADVTIIPDQLFARVSIATKHRDGYVDRVDYACSHPGSGLPTLKSGNGCKLGTLGGQSYTAGRMALRWTPSEKLEVNWAADIINDNSEAVANTLLYADSRSQQTVNGVTYDGKFVPYGVNSRDPNRPNDPYLSYATFVDVGGFPGFIDPVTGNNKAPSKPVAFSPLNTFKGWGTNLNVEYKLTDDLQLTSITSFRYYDNTFSNDTDSSPIAVDQLQQRLESKQWSQELRLNGRFGQLVDYTVGGFYNKQDGTLQARVDLPYVNAGPGQFGPLDFIHGPDITKSRTMAAFLHTEWHLTDRLGVSGGVRYSRENKLYVYQRHNPDGTVPRACFTTPLTQNGVTYIPPFRPDNPQNCSLFGLNDSQARFPGPTGDAKRWDWRIDANYKITDTILGYAQVSTGY
jgi:iron complex outermembrane receptor protein